jgi:hypothetical protein
MNEDKQSDFPIVNFSFVSSDIYIFSMYINKYMYYSYFSGNRTITKINTL